MCYKPAKLHQGVRVHEHEDAQGLLVREAVKPRRVIFLLAAHVCLQKLGPSLVLVGNIIESTNHVVQEEGKLKALFLEQSEISKMVFNNGCAATIMSSF